MITSFLTVLLFSVLANPKVTAKLDLLARIFLGILFLIAGLGKLTAPQLTQDLMTTIGMSDIFFYPTVIFEIIGGLMLIVGFKSRLAAAALAGFTIAASILFHNDFGDRAQIGMFLKNIAVAGGLVMLAKHGSQSFSLDGLFGKEEAGSLMEANSQNPVE